MGSRARGGARTVHAYPADDDWVCGDGRVLRRHHETFWMWPAPRGEVIAELEERGFVPLPERPDPSVLAVRLAQP
ncbi:hypothetical protein OOK12_42205 [Streptomyces sp. NBC_00452]|uniref:hypothetical protein n=1 Tax=Streptomyces sp. NBC_00452 TaxID=2975746 RepID=UPI00224EA5B0|nr:hypothetical protein [Streptomyces sp. NBC_00452]MCX5063510.1 hypothetical protein [Streptomyces sp. NBC_00452]